MCDTYTSIKNCCIAKWANPVARRAPRAMNALLLLYMMHPAADWPRLFALGRTRATISIGLTLAGAPPA